MGGPPADESEPLLLRGEEEIDAAFALAGSRADIELRPVQASMTRATNGCGPSAASTEPRGKVASQCREFTGRSGRPVP